MPKKFYAVARGSNVGVFNSWGDCEPLVKGYANARFKSFSSMEEAQSFIRDNAASSASPTVGSSSYSTSYAATSYAPKASYAPATSYAPKASYAPATSYAPKASATSYAPKTSHAPATTPARRSPSLQPQVVYTDGACPSNGRKGARGGYGVYFEPNPYFESEGVINPVSKRSTPQVDPRHISEPLKPGDKVTNNVAELRGIISALEWAVDRKSVAQQEEVRGHGRLKPGQPLHIYTDSTYCIKGCTEYLDKWVANGFKKADKTPVLNKELWQTVHKLMTDVKQLYGSQSGKRGEKRPRDEPAEGAVKFVHVKGHAGVAGNELADSFAVQGALRH